MLLPLLLLLAPAYAQDQNEDLEYRDVEVGEGDTELEVRAGVESQWHEYDNLDLRKLDESSDQNIFDSDDRNAFAFTGAYVELAASRNDVRMVVGASHRGLWGNDQIGNTNRFGGWMYFTAMYVEYTPTLGNITPTIRVGRQYYELGSLGGARDYVLADVVDQVRIDVPLGDFGRLELVPITVVGMSSSNDNANFVGYLGQSTAQTYGFRGDHMTRRYGGSLVMDGVGTVDARAYGFFTQVGALGTGSDISYNGQLGNFSDNDWVSNFGVRGSMVLAAGKVTPFVSLDGSMGVDRKEEVAQDVNTNGWAVTAGVRGKLGDEETGLRGELSYFQASGGAYGNGSGTSGLQYSHGYTGMKGRQVGGTFTDRLMGWHPSSYVGMFGISDTPQEIDRKSGTRVVHGAIGYDFGRAYVGGRWWTLQDTGITYVNFNQLDTLDPPYGYSRAEWAAQERLGKLLGHEADLDVVFAVNDTLRVYGNAAVFLPGPYYEIGVERVAGDALGWDGEALPWALNVGTSVRF